MICSGRRRKGRAWRRAARRRRSPAKPRAAKEEICFARRRDGNARLSLARRRTSAAWRRAAKEEQRNARTREGPATDRYAEALGSSAMTGNEPMRRGVEQPSWDMLRIEWRRHRRVTRREAKEKRGMAQLWRSKAASCNGDGLIRAAKALL